MKNKGYLPYIFFLLVLLVFIVISGFNGLYGQDSYEYLRYSECLNTFIKTGANPGDYFWPLLYPITGALLSFVLSPVFALQLISILSLIFSAIYLEKLLILLFNTDKKAIRIYALLFFLLSPYMLRGSLVIMSDSLSVFCVVAAWYYFEKYRRESVNKYFLSFTFFSLAAIATRYAAAIVLIIPIILASIIFLKNFKISGFFGAILIAIFLFIPHFLIRHINPFGFLHHTWVMAWSPLNFFRNHFDTLDGSSSYSFYNLLYSFYNLFHPAFCFAGVIFLIALGGERKQLLQKRLGPILISISLYAIFLAGIPFQNLRFLLLSLPLVLVIMLPGYLRIYEYLITRKFLKYVFIITLLIQMAFLYRVFMPFYNDNKTEKQIAHRMLKYQNATVYTFSIDGALRSYGFKGNIINMWQVRLDTLKVMDTNSLVLFSVKQFSEEWHDKNPMINWEYLNAKSKLVPLENLMDGWVIYKIGRLLPRK